jgi:serine/threonine-protein kinase RsbW
MSTSALKNQFCWKYPATLKNLEQVCASVVQVLEKYDLHHKDRFAIELLLREALNNAVLHGCHQNPHLFFSCSLTISAPTVTIEVCDEGNGFDWRRLTTSTPMNSKISGRGLYIYTIYASTIRFNDSGNCVTMTRICTQGEKDD